jgi:hypothetical protein
MNVYHSWFFSTGYIVKLVEIAAIKGKAWHKSKASYFSPMQNWGWLEISRQTAHNTWYELTDLGLRLVHRFLCAFLNALFLLMNLKLPCKITLKSPVMNAGLG